MSYESPITIMIDQMRLEQEKRIEGEIFRAVQGIGINVDKDELIKALRYDRNQYEKGYLNGYRANASEVAREIFEEIENNSYSYGINFVISKETLAELKKKYTEEGK